MEIAPKPALSALSLSVNEKSFIRSHTAKVQYLPSANCAVGSRTHRAWVVGWRARSLCIKRHGKSESISTMCSLQLLNARCL